MPIVTAVGISVNTVHGRDVDKLVEQAMADEVLRCTAEGISTEECNAPIIRARMAAARAKALEDVAFKEGQ